MHFPSALKYSSAYKAGTASQTLPRSGQDWRHVSAPERSSSLLPTVSYYRSCNLGSRHVQGADSCSRSFPTESRISCYSKWTRRQEESQPQSSHHPPQFPCLQPPCAPPASGTKVLSLKLVSVLWSLAALAGDEQGANVAALALSLFEGRRRVMKVSLIVDQVCGRREACTMTVM